MSDDRDHPGERVGDVEARRDLGPFRLGAPAAPFAAEFDVEAVRYRVEVPEQWSRYESVIRREITDVAGRPYWSEDLLEDPDATALASAGLLDTLLGAVLAGALVRYERLGDEAEPEDKDRTGMADSGVSAATLAETAYLYLTDAEGKP